MKLKAPNLTWRTRKRLKVLGMTLGILTVTFLVLWLCWVIWLGRFVVYSRDAVRLDFDWQTPGPFVTAEPPEKQTVNILYDDGKETVVERKKELAQLSGCYITTDLLTGDMEEINRLVREQPKGSAIALELKSGSGTYFYKTTMPDASISSRIDKAAVTELIKYLAKADYYTIAMVPAFRDRAFGLKNTSYGILHSSGGYLWAGSWSIPGTPSGWTLTGRPPDPSSPPSPPRSCPSTFSTTTAPRRWWSGKRSWNSSPAATSPRICSPATWRS